MSATTLRAGRLLPRAAAAAASVTLLAAVGCGNDERSFAGLDGPADIAYLEPGLFFEVPVAFVSNSRSGRVVKLDLKRSNLLVEDGPAPWLPGPDLAFGADRALAEIALAVGDETVDVWVSDDGTDELLRTPYIIALDAEGRPIWYRATLGDDLRVFGPPTDGSGVGPLLSGDDLPELRELRVRPARAATETWRLTWKGRGFEVRGTQGGLQRAMALPGTPYETDRGELAFTVALRGNVLERGAYLELDTVSGVEAADAGGFVTDLLAEPDGDWIFATVIPVDGPGWISVWDAPGFRELDRLELPAGAAPERLAPGRDEGVIWVSDSAELPGGDDQPFGSGRVWRLDYIPGDLDTLALTAVPTPEPAIDVAEGRDPVERLLFVAAAYSDRVWAMDPDDGSVLDTNPVTAEVDPTQLGSIISGLTATEGPVQTALLDEDGTRLMGHGVMATTFAGEMYWLDAATGCQAFGTPGGPFLTFDQADGCSIYFSDVGFASSPLLVEDEASGRCGAMNACGGVTRTETWTFIYDESVQAYDVRGSVTGEQLGLAYEGERYFTDKGELSVLLLPGTLPTSDGDRWRLPVNSGISPVDLHELPGDPMVYTELYDDRSGDWWKVRERQIAVVPHVGNDVVLWIDIQGQGLGGIRVYQ